MTAVATARPKTKSQEVAADVAALIRSRNACIWIVTKEETRVETHLFAAILSAKYEPRTWDVAQGAILGIGAQARPVGPDSVTPDAVLKLIAEASKVTVEEQKKRGVWILRDLPTWINRPGGERTLRTLRNNAKSLPGTPREVAQAMIILSPNATVPPELADHTTVIEWPLPDRAEIAEILDTAVTSMADVMPRGIPAALRDAAIDAAVGLSGEEAKSCFARSLVHKRIEPVLVAKEKRRVVSREGLLEWFDPIPEGLAAVGGLDRLKAWLTQRSAAFTAKARAYGLPMPKGGLLVGVSGCGKSLTAKAIATAWGVPLLRLDLGALKGSLVGQSERNIRQAFRVIEAVGRCVVWLDEVEKALAGATQGARDGGVSSDALGSVLSWMQERHGEAFIIATANDISGLPPEFLRKGRFDEIWFIDLPNPTERVEVLKAALRAHKRGDVKIDHKKVASACENFTGSEIAEIVPDALYRAFEDNAREIRTSDLLEAAKTVIPLSKTMSEKIKELRDWAKTRARAATSNEAPRAQHDRVTTRQLDVDEETEA